MKPKTELHHWEVQVPFGLEKRGSVATILPESDVDLLLGCGSPNTCQYSTSVACSLSY